MFTLFTNDAELAAAADRAGVERIGPDLEVIGKLERQAGLGTRISEHSIADARAVFPRLSRAERFARVNPVNPGTTAEIEALITAGATVLMLPYFKTAQEVAYFVEAVGGRALTVGLVETGAALSCIGDIVGPGMLDEVHFGFTDLGIELGKRPPEMLADMRFLAAVETLRAKAVPFGIAGVARPDDTSLPYDPAAFAKGVAKCGATRTIIARSFLRERPPSAMGDDVRALRAFLSAVVTE